MGAARRAGQSPGGASCTHGRSWRAPDFMQPPSIDPSPSAVCSHSIVLESGEGNPDARFGARLYGVACVFN